MHLAQQRAMEEALERSERWLAEQGGELRRVRERLAATGAREYEETRQSARQLHAAVQQVQQRDGELQSLRHALSSSTSHAAHRQQNTLETTARQGVALMQLEEVLPLVCIGSLLRASLSAAAGAKYGATAGVVVDGCVPGTTMPGPCPRAVWWPLAPTSPDPASAHCPSPSPHAGSSGDGETVGGVTSPASAGPSPMAVGCTTPPGYALLSAEEGLRRRAAVTVAAERLLCLHAECAATALRAGLAERGNTVDAAESDRAAAGRNSVVPFLRAADGRIRDVQQQLLGSTVADSNSGRACAAAAPADSAAELRRTDWLLQQLDIRGRVLGQVEDDLSDARATVRAVSADAARRQREGLACAEHAGRGDVVAAAQQATLHTTAAVFRALRACVAAAVEAERRRRCAASAATYPSSCGGTTRPPMSASPRRVGLER